MSMMMGWLSIAAMGQAAPAPERLSAPMPAGFRVGFTATQGGQSIEERVPASESVEAWTRMVTIQRLSGLAALGAHRLLDRMGAMWSGSCPGATVSPVEDAVVDGRAVASFSVTCPRNSQTGKPETMFARAFDGASDLHIAQYAFRSIPTAHEAEAATAYLQGVHL
jgi:hypothetical protein